MRNVCVYCGSSPGRRDDYVAAARAFARELVARDLGLVYGGASVGVMGAVADAVLAGGGEVIGIIPEFLKDLEVGNDAVTEQIVTGSMHARKTRMFELADGFVVLPGGLGTLDETLEIITWKQLQLHAKPVVVLNTDGYWSVFEDLIRRTVDSGFAHSAVAELFTMVAEPEDVFPALAAQPEPKEEVLTSHL